VPYEKNLFVSVTEYSTIHKICKVCNGTSPKSYLYKG